MLLGSLSVWVDAMKDPFDPVVVNSEPGALGRLFAEVGRVLNVTSERSAFDAKHFSSSCIG